MALMLFFIERVCTAFVHRPCDHCGAIVVFVLIHIPVIFLLVCMGTTALSSAFSVVILQMHHGSYSKPPPGLIKGITAWLLRNQNIQSVKDASQSNGPSPESTPDCSSCCPTLAVNRRQTGVFHVTAVPLADGKNKNAQTDSQESDCNVTLAWRQAARAMDILCFRIFAIMLILLIIAVVIVRFTKQ